MVFHSFRREIGLTAIGIERIIESALRHMKSQSTNNKKQTNNKIKTQIYQTYYATIWKF